MKKAIFAIATLLLFAVGGCGTRQTRHTMQIFDLFDTVTVITGYADSKTKFEEDALFLLNELEKYDKLFDIYNNYDGINNLKTINDNAGICATVVDDEIIDMLELAVTMHSLTNGKINVAMGGVLKIWHDYRENGIASPEDARIPSEKELSAAAEHTDISELIINKADNTVYINDPLMSLDVGAIAKGYAVERVCESAKLLGINNFLVSVGGNVCAIGPKPDGSYWSVGIENGVDGNYTSVIEVCDTSVVTSGTYRRYYMANGKKYHHIIDPETLMPSDKYLSVTVVCNDSGIADALSTALFNMDADDGKKLIDDMPNAEALWILADGSKTYSSGFEKLISDKN